MAQKTLEDFVDLSENQKKCSICNEFKPLDKFCKDKHRPDGKATKCKDCVKIYNEMTRERRHRLRRENPEKYRNNERNYYTSHIESCKASRKRYYELNRESAIEYKKKYYQDNRDKFINIQRRYYNTHRKECILKSKIYTQENIEKVKQRRNDWAKSSSGKVITRLHRLRHILKSRNPINEYFLDSHYHHIMCYSNRTIENDIGIYIPSNIHKSIWHNSKTGQNMDKINKLAIEWYISTCENPEEGLKKIGFNSISEFKDRYP